MFCFIVFGVMHIFFGNHCEHDTPTIFYDYTRSITEHNALYENLYPKLLNLRMGVSQSLIIMILNDIATVFYDMKILRTWMDGWMDGWKGRE